MYKIRINFNPIWGFMACCTGYSHTVCLSDAGELYSFGRNDEGQLGLEYPVRCTASRSHSVLRPTLLPNLPKIKMVSCGAFFTICVDEEGIIWSFGYNNFGQLGIGKQIEESFNIPQKVQLLSPVQTISCGHSHTIVITNDEDLWSFGFNDYAQLCLGNQVEQFEPQQTQFYNIKNISAGQYHSFFQDYKGDIYGCGLNLYGQLGVGVELGPVVEPRLLEIQAANNILSFCCGRNFSLFLDCDGKVFSAGENTYGSLGLGTFGEEHQNVFVQISTIPQIQSIACAGHSVFLIDFDGNVWSFGLNDHGQLGLEIKDSVNIPTKINSISNITEISCGTCSSHVLAKDSQGRIFVFGNNDAGQLGRKPIYMEHNSTPKEMNLENSFASMWGKPRNRNSAKSARK